jgi:hypothetical protein
VSGGPVPMAVVVKFAFNSSAENAYATLSTFSRKMPLRRSQYLRPTLFCREIPEYNKPYEIIFIHHIPNPYKI